MKEILESNNQRSKNILKAFGQQSEIEKGGKKAMLGEIRTFGSRQYIKTTQGWKFHGKGIGKKAKEHIEGLKKEGYQHVFSQKEKRAIKIDEHLGLKQSNERTQPNIPDTVGTITGVKGEENRQKKDKEQKITRQGIIDYVRKEFKVEADEKREDMIVIYPTLETTMRENLKGFSKRQNPLTLKLKIKDGELYFSSAYGYHLSSLATELGVQYRDFGIGQGGVDSSMKPIKIKKKDIKRFIDSIQQGIAKESKAQKDFYRTHKPD